MTATVISRRKPPIIVSRSEHEKLVRLAEAHATRSPDVTEELLAELDRARVVADARLPAATVRMGSSVRYTTDSGEERSVTLVYPAGADIAAGKVSILTPVGAALIGLSAGQSIDWSARDGRVHRLTVKAVGTEAAADHGERAS